MANEKLKGGIIIIGSLFWQDDSEFGNWDNVRKIWRDTWLDMSQAIKVKFPLKYGRISRSKETTMCLNKNNPNGIAWFVPFKEIKFDFNDSKKEQYEILVNALRVARSEGLCIKKLSIDDSNSFDDFDNKSFDNEIWQFLKPSFDYFLNATLEKQKPKEARLKLFTSWLITSINFKTFENSGMPNNVAVAANAVRVAYTKFEPLKYQLKTSYYNTKRELMPDYKRNKAELNLDDSDNLPIKQDGIFEIPQKIRKGNWLEAVISNNQESLNEYSYFITCVLPPSYIEMNGKKVLAEVDLNYDKNRFYFFNNLACGIRTEDDFKNILTDVTHNCIRTFKTNFGKGSIPLFVNDNSLKLGDWAQVQDSKLFLYFVKGKLLLIEPSNGEVIWQTKTKTDEGERIIFQNDGNLVIYDKADGVQWASHTRRDKDNERYNTVIFDQLGIKFVNSNGHSPYLPQDHLDDKPSEHSDLKSFFNGMIFKTMDLKPGEYIQNGNAKLVFDTKGRLLLFHNDELKWFSKKGNGVYKDELGKEDGYGGGVATFQSNDGNLVIYNKEARGNKGNSAVWSSGPGNSGPYYLKLTEEGGLSVIDRHGTQHWSANHFDKTPAYTEYVHFTDKLTLKSWAYDIFNTSLKKYNRIDVDGLTFHDEMCNMPEYSIFTHHNHLMVKSDSKLHYYKINKDSGTYDLINVHETNESRSSSEEQKNRKFDINGELIVYSLPNSKVNQIEEQQPDL